MENEMTAAILTDETKPGGRAGDSDRWYMDSKFMRWYIEKATACSWDRRNGALYGCVIVARKCGQNDTETRNAVEYLALELGKANGKKIPEDEIAYALRHLKDENLHLIRRETLSAITGIEMQPSKRNGRTMKEHQKYRRECEAEDRETHPEKYAPFCKKVSDWRVEHPGGKKTECARELGCSRPTVDRWWEFDPSVPNPTAKSKKPKKKTRLHADDKRRLCPECHEYSRRHTFSEEIIDEKHQKVYSHTVKCCRKCGAVLSERKQRNHKRETELGFDPIPISMTTQYKAIQFNRAESAKRRGKTEMPWKS